MKTEEMNKKLLAALFAYSARKPIQDAAKAWAEKLVSVSITNDAITVIYTNGEGEGEEPKTVTRSTVEFLADIFARHDHLVLPPVPQSQYPDIIEWLGESGKVTRETTTGKVWCFVKPELMQTVPAGWTWGLPKGAVSDTVPPGYFSIVLEKGPISIP